MGTATRVRLVIWTSVLVLVAAGIAAAQGSSFYVTPQFRQHVPIILSASGQGTGYYVRDNVQTVAHVVSDSLTVMVGGVHGKVLCTSALTDSATVAPLVAGPSLPVSSWRATPGERVTVAGWRRGVYTEVSTIITKYGDYTTVEDYAGNEHVVGPYMAMWSNGDNLGGMSGGPILNRFNQVVGTFFAWGVFEIFGVPIDGAVCRIR